MSRLNQHDEYIREALAAGTAPTHIAKTLGVPRSTLRDYIDQCKLERPAPPSEPQPQQVTREQMLEQQLGEARQALSRRTKADVAQERIIQSIADAVGGVAPPTEVHLAPADPADPKQERHHRQVLLLSDFHGGEVVDAEALNYRNAYSWAIMEARVEELMDAVLSHKRNSPALTGLDVLFVGDMCSGSNHQELAETNEYPLAEQAVRMGHLQAQILRRLHPHYENMRVGVVVGNHPRLPTKPAAKNVHDNGDWIAGVVMQEGLRQYPNIAVTVSRSAAMLWQVAGRTLYVWHGDGVRSSMPGVPWGGVMRRVNAIQASHRQPIHHFVCGHYHQANVVQAGRIIMNGALKGTDEWVEKSFGGGEPPTQLLLTFDERRQRLTDHRYITPTAGIPA